MRPPDDDGGRALGPPTTEKVVTQPPDTEANIKPQCHAHSTAWCPVEAARRRRQAAVRSVPRRCGCRDPWVCRCADSLPSQRMADAGAAAAAHLLAADLPPMLDTATLRAMWRQRHHRLVQRCRDTYGLAS